MASKFHWTLGATTLQRIVECEEGILPPTEIYGECTQAHLDEHRHWLVPRFQDAASGLLIISIQSFLVRQDGLNILVDTCGGNDKERKRPHFHKQNRPWLDTLRAAGVGPEDIDIVLCTHLHVDHVGWNTRLENGRWVPTFPKARYLVSQREWDYWRNAGPAALERTGDFLSDAVLPIIQSGQADFVGDTHAIKSDISLEPAYGHTPGQMMMRHRLRRRPGAAMRRPHASPTADQISRMEHAVLRRSDDGAADPDEFPERQRQQRAAGVPDPFPRSDRRHHRARRRRLSFHLRRRARAGVSVKQVPAHESFNARAVLGQFAK